MLQILKRVINLSLFFIVISPLFANNQVLLQSIVKKYKDAQTLSCKIEQINTFPAQKKTLISKGLLLKNDNIYLIEFTTPNYQFVKFSDNEIIIYDAQSKSAHIVPKKSFPSFNPKTLFSEIEQGRFTLDSSTNRFLLTIDSFKKQINQLEIVLSKNLDYIQSIQYEDQMGNEVKINLSKPEIDKKNKYNLKTYTYPKDTKVLKQ